MAKRLLITLVLLAPLVQYGWLGHIIDLISIWIYPNCKGTGCPK